MIENGFLLTYIDKNRAVTDYEWFETEELAREFIEERNDYIEINDFIEVVAARDIDL